MEGQAEAANPYECQISGNGVLSLCQGTSGKMPSSRLDLKSSNLDPLSPIHPLLSLELEIKNPREEGQGLGAARR